MLRFIRDGGDDRLLLVNLGAEVELDIAPEPLLAPPAGQSWRLLWSSEDPRYGGAGTPELREPWCLPAETTLVLAPGLTSSVSGGFLGLPLSTQDTGTRPDGRATSHR